MKRFLLATTLAAALIGLPQAADASTYPYLHIQSRGSAVKTLQTDLMKAGVYHGPVTGYFGTLTRSSVILFQRRHRLRASGAVDTATWRALIQAMPKPVVKPPAGLPLAAGIVNPNQVYTYEIMQHDINALVAKYPNLVHERVIGTTAYGRNLYAVSVGTGPATTLVVGSMHAREWITTNLSMYMLAAYADAYQRNTSIKGTNVRALLNQTTLWFVPMSNPDGVTLAQRGANAFPASARAGLIAMNHNSTNFSDWKANAQGIDLNRQYDGGWAGINVDPVNHPWYKDYKGIAPYTTAETQALLSFIAQINPQAEVNYHASGNAIYWGYRLQGATYTTDLADAWALGQLTGYRLMMPIPNQSGGGLTDWWTQQTARPGFTVEVGPYYGESPVPTKYIGSIWSSNQGVGVYLARLGAALYNQHPTQRVNVPTQG